MQYRLLNNYSHASPALPKQENKLTSSFSKLKSYLDSFLDSFDYSSHLSKDPVCFLHQYDDPKDQEVVGLIASSLVYGRVDKILEFLNRLFQIMGQSPYQFMMGFDPSRDRKLFHSFIYRFHRGAHLACFLYLLKQVLTKHDSLENLFLKNMNLASWGRTLGAFVGEILDQDVSPFYPSGRLPKNSPVRFFLPSPLDGSTCKRLNLFLRWMVRGPDQVDLGLWKNVSKKNLFIPVDTHIARICKYLGLSETKALSWKMSEEITQNLRLLDADDPIKYDFAICHLGISGECPSKPVLEKCEPCQLRPVCKFWRYLDGKTKLSARVSGWNRMF